MNVWGWAHILRDIDIREDDPPARRVNKQNTNIVIFNSVISASTYFFVSLLMREWTMVWISGIGTLSYLVAFAIKASGRSVLGSNLFLIFAWILVFLATQSMGKSSGLPVFYAAGIVVAFMVFERSEKLFFYGQAALSLTFWVLIEILPDHFLVPSVRDPSVYHPAYAAVLVSGIIFLCLNFHQSLFEEAQEKLTQSNVTLIENSRLASLGEMSGGVAHEINTPLAIIIAKIEWILQSSQEGTMTPAKLQSDLSLIDRSCTRIDKIVKSLRMYSRNGEKDPFKPEDLKTIIQDTLLMCQERMAKYGIELKLGNIPQATIQCRGTQISQVLLNLINNAFDAVVQTSHPWIEIDGKKIGEDRIRITVMDSGIGISPEVAAKIMQPFFTTKPVGKGTGLGLSISHGIVKDHEGNLLLDTANTHTCFIMELPMAQTSCLSDTKLRFA